MTAQLMDSDRRSREHKLLSEFTLDILYVDTIFYSYILKCNNGTKYYGHASDLTGRLAYHSAGRVWSTKNKRPIELIYYEEFSSLSQAHQREMQFKNGNTRKKTIEKLINSFPSAKCQGFNSRPSLTFLRPSAAVRK